MAGYGTVDRRDQRGAQLTFPSIFEHAYVASGMGSAFAPQYQYGPVVHYAGRDFQADYHEQSRLDAHRRVMNGVRDTAAGRARSFASHAGVYGMPKPVLGQRRFANPSNGAYSNHSARRDIVGAPFSTVETGMTGGVLRSEQGQIYGRQRLNDRIAQLNRLDAAYLDFAQLGELERVPAAREEELPETTLGERTKLEFNLLRQRVLDGLTMGSTSDVTTGDINRMLLILFRYVPTATDDELDDIWTGFTGEPAGMLTLARQMTDEDYDPPNRNQFSEAVSQTIYVLMDKATEYVRVMIENRNRSPREKKALSQNLIRSLGFTRILRNSDSPLEALKDAKLTRRQQQAFDNHDGDDADFDQSALPREEEEQRGETARFNVDERQVFGRESGAYFGEEMPDSRREAADLAAREEANQMDVDEDAAEDEVPQADDDELSFNAEPQTRGEVMRLTVDQLKRLLENWTGKVPRSENKYYLRNIAYREFKL